MRKLAMLMVEDEPIQRLVLVDDLEELGYTVYQAGGAAEARQKIETCDDIQLVFTDVQMPGAMNGIDLLKQVFPRWLPLAHGNLRTFKTGKRIFA